MIASRRNIISFFCLSLLISERLRLTAAGSLQDLPQCGTNLAATDAVLTVQALLATEPAPDAVVTAASKAAAAAAVSRFLEAAGLQALLKVQLALSSLTVLHQVTCQCCNVAQQCLGYMQLVLHQCYLALSFAAQPFLDPAAAAAAQYMS